MDKKEKSPKEDLHNILTLFQNRMKEYYEAERNTERDGPVYWAGKKFFENLTGKNQSHINDYNKDADMAHWEQQKNKDEKK